MTHLRLFLVGLIAATLTACTAPDLATEGPAKPLGNFTLGHGVVTVSRDQISSGEGQPSAEDWQAAMKSAMLARLDRYEGDVKYHVGLNIDGANVAAFDIPLLPSPKSYLFVTANVFANRKEGGKLVRVSGDPYQLMVVAPLQSRMNKSADEITDYLVKTMAKRVETWMNEHPEWFNDPGAAAAAN
jgi:hypothetical protein